MSHDLGLQILILLSASIFFATIFFYLHLPTIVGFILGGMVVGPYGFKIVNTLPEAKLVTEFGITLLLFTIGLEFSFSRIRHLKNLFLGLGFGQVVATSLIIGGLFYLFGGYNVTKSIFMGCILSLSSTAIVMKILQDSRETASPYGTASIAILLSQDLAVIPMMLGIPLFVAGQNITGEFSYVKIFTWVGHFALVIFTIWLGTRFIFPYIMDRIIKTHSRELFFFSIVILCFGVALAFEGLGMPLSLGAFLAGLMISEYPYGKQATSIIVPMRDNFLGIVFASVGMLLDLGFVLENLSGIILFTVAVIVIKTAVVFLLCLAAKIPFKTALITCIAVFQVGEFSFILAEKGFGSGILSKMELQYFLAVSIITMILTPVLFKLTILNVKKLVYSKTSNKNRKLSEEISEIELPPTQVVVIGYGVAGRNLVNILKNLDISYSIIDQNYKTVKEQSKRGDNIFYGDATQREILENSGIEKAELVIIAVSGVDMTSAIANSVRILRPDIRMVIRLQYSLQCDDFKNMENIELIVAEYETTVELLARTLGALNLPFEQIEEYKSQTKADFLYKAKGITDYIRRSKDLPAWQALSAFKTITVNSQSNAINKSIQDLAFRSKTGATILTVFRKNEGTSIPSSDFIFQAGDIIHILADNLSFESAKKLLT